MTITKSTYDKHGTDNNNNTDNHIIHNKKPGR